jgi:hypothetical protein
MSLRDHRQSPQDAAPSSRIQPPAQPLTAEVAFTIALDRWRELLTALAPSLPLPTTHDELLTTLAVTPRPAKLEEAVETLMLLGSDAGETALYNAAAALNWSTASFRDEDSPSEIVVGLLLNSNARAADVLQCARLEIESRLLRTVSVAFQGQADRFPVKAPPNLRALERALADRLKSDSRTPYVEARVALQDATGIVFDVHRPTRRRTFCELDGTRSRRGRVTLVSDLVRLDEARRLLFVSTESASLRRVYAEVFGQVLLGDAAAFLEASPRETVSLTPVHERGQAALDIPAMRATITRARVVHLAWDTGEDVVRTFDGRDVLRDSTFAGGFLERAVIRLNFADEGPKADILVAGPNTIEVYPTSRRDLALSFLEAAGILAPPAPSSDLWRLEPFNHPLATWASALDADTLRDLQKQGILVAEETRALVDPEQPAAGRSLLAFPIRGQRARFYAVARDAHNSSARPRRVRDRDLLTYRLDLPKYAGWLSKALTLEGPAEALGAGLYALGNITIGTRVARILLATTTSTVRGPGAEKRLRSAARGAEIAVIVPPGRALDGAFAEVELACLDAPSRADLIPRLIRALSIDDEDLDPTLLAPKGTRWVLDRARQRAWLDGVLLTRMTDSVFRFLCVLADAKDAQVSGKEASRVISPHRDDFLAARETNQRLKKVVQSSFADAGKKPPDVQSLIFSDVRGYRLLGGVLVR